MTQLGPIAVRRESPLQLISLKFALKDISLQQARTLIEASFLRKHPGHAVDPNASAAQLAQLAGQLQELGIADSYDNSLRQPGDFCQGLPRCRDSAAGLAQLAPPLVAERDRWPDCHVHAMAAPQPQHVPGMTERPADAAEGAAGDDSHDSRTVRDVAAYRNLDVEDLDQPVYIDG